MKHSIRWIMMTLINMGMLLSACARGPASPARVEPATLEEIEGSDFGRVILTAKAAERIGLQTTLVRDEQVARRQIVGGEVVAQDSLTTIPVTGGSGGGSASLILVRVSLNRSEFDRVDPSQPARVLPIDDDKSEGFAAEAFEMDEIEDADEPGDIDTALYYTVDGANFAPGQRVFVEFSLTESTAQLTVIPYAALIYDVDGGTWVYIKEPNALAFVRRNIAVDYIEGDLAFLTEGPAVGTEVVTVGGAELYGTETGVSK